MLSTEQKLIQAIVNGDLEEVKKSISTGADVNTRCSKFIDKETELDGDTPLHIAAHFGYLDIMKYLIDKGADLSARCNAGNTPLANTIIANQFKAFEFLIAKGADIESENQDGNTALHMAFICVRENMINALMEIDIKDINKQNNSGRTLLYMAAQKDNHQFIKPLLNKGADPNIPNINGYTPLLATVIEGRNYIKPLELLLEDERTDLNIKSNKGECFVSIVLNGVSRSNDYLDLSETFKKPEYYLIKNYYRLNDESQKIFKANPVALCTLFKSSILREGSDEGQKALKENPAALCKLFERSIFEEDLDRTKELFSKLPLSDEVYKSIFLDRYPRLPTFYAMQKRNDNLQEINNLLIKKVPYDFLLQYINFIFSYAQDVIPQLLEIISESCRDDIFIKKEEVAYIEWRISNIEKIGTPYDPRESFAAYSCSNKNSDYYNAKEAIEKYCEKNINEDYYITPYYLFPIKDTLHFKGLKQHFKDIYSAINSNDFNKVESSLKLIEANIRESDMDINAISRALTVLVKEAKSNENIARLISNSQADITFPGQCLKNIDLSADYGKGIERKR